MCLKIYKDPCGRGGSQQASEKARALVRVRGDHCSDQESGGRDRNI